MRSWGLIARVAAVVLIASTASARVVRYEPKWDGHFSLGLGLKDLGSDWGSGRRQMALGFLFDARRIAWPVGIAADAFYAQEDADVGAALLNLDTGLRWTYQKGRWLWPYLGGGPSFAYARAEADGVHGQGFGAGWWLGGGMLFPMDSRVYGGVDIRYADTRVDLNGIGGSDKANVGGFCVLGVVGSRW